MSKAGRDKCPNWMVAWALKRTDSPYSVFSPERIGHYLAEQAILKEQEREDA